MIGLIKDLLDPFFGGVSCTWDAIDSGTAWLMLLALLGLIAGALLASPIIGMVALAAFFVGGTAWLLSGGVRLIVEGASGIWDLFAAAPPDTLRTTAAEILANQRCMRACLQGSVIV